MAKVQVRDEDGFQMVRRKKQKKALPKLLSVGSSNSEEEEGLPVDYIVTKIKKYRISIQQSQFLEQVKSHIECSKFEEMVSYGIGHIGSCPIARQQLALLLELCPKGTPCRLYDPVLSSREREAVERTGCILLPHNEMCRHTISCHTLFYMPHCGRAMYNNLLWSNWSPTLLTQVTIIGNKLSSYLERLPRDQLSKEAPYVLKATQYCTEVSFPNTYPDTTVFNDLAIHTFPEEKLLTATPKEWTDCIEPIIDLSDSEMIIT